jgi:hypothetical protein
MPKKLTEPYLCECCDFKCSKKSNYDNHLLTRKHKQAFFRTKKCLTTNKSQNENFVCECGKSYKARNSLWYHRQKCSKQLTEHIENVTISLDKNKTIETDTEHDTVNELKNMIKTLVNENREMRHEIVELAKKPITQNNMTINMYLNNKCSDAMDIIKFIETIQVSRDQLLYTKENGLAMGVSNVLITELNEMEVTERPIHCVDSKRQQFFIKDGDWRKDNVEDTMDKVVYGISHKHFVELEEWDKDHPNWRENNTDSEVYLNIAKQCANTKDDAEKNRKKVMKALSENINLKLATKNNNNNE